MGTPAYLSPEQAEGTHGDPGLRRLLARRRGLRVPGRPQPVRRRHRRRDRDRPSPQAGARAARRRARRPGRASSAGPWRSRPRSGSADGAAFAAALRDPSSVVPAAAAPPRSTPLRTQVIGDRAVPRPVTSHHPGGRTRRRAQRRWWPWLLLGLAVIAAVAAYLARPGQRRRPRLDPTEPSTSAPTSEQSPSQTTQGRRRTSASTRATTSGDRSTRSSTSWRTSAYVRAQRARQPRRRASRTPSTA